MARTKWGPDLIGLWSHMRTLVTQPNSNLRKTFNSSPKQNCDSEPPLPSNDFEQPIPTSSNASPPNEFIIKKIERPREKYLYLKCTECSSSFDKLWLRRWPSPLR